MDILSLIGRDQELFTADILSHESELRARITSSRFLVLGGAGSIGQDKLEEFSRAIEAMKARRDWTKEGVVDMFLWINPDFSHKETGRYLEGKM